uniref:Uncharacterized protein n=1 Tax=Solanum lycopersicum TaxID=4081 RepID=A0A3Q7HBY7_SOLLC
MDSLFRCIPGDQGKDARRRKASSFFYQTSQCVQIIDHKKSQNLAILLKASNVTTEEVYDAFEEVELLEMVACFLDFHDISEPPNLTMNPVTDLLGGFGFLNEIDITSSDHQVIYIY